jgi:hypothetical protein
VSCVRTRAKSAAAWITGTAAAAAAGALLGGCASAPAPAPELTGLAGNAGVGPGYHDTRITLPETVSLSFHHPQQTGRTEHEVLFTVQQALRSQLYAEYSGSGPGNTPLLATYWSGSALTAAQNEIAGWQKKHEQPVGVLVITDTSYTAPNASGTAQVSYCANWADVLAGNADTHVVGNAVQPSGTQGTYTTLTLTRTGTHGHHWQVQNLAATANSAHCPNTAGAATPSDSDID